MKKRKIYWVYIREAALPFLQHSGVQITHKDDIDFIYCKKVTETMHFVNIISVHRDSPDSDSGYELELSLPYEYVLFVASVEDLDSNKSLGFKTSHANGRIRR